MRSFRISFIKFLDVGSLNLNKGFSFLETLVSISIMGIISLSSASLIISQREDVRDMEKKVDILDEITNFKNKLADPENCFATINALPQGNFSYLNTGLDHLVVQNEEGVSVDLFSSIRGVSLETVKLYSNFRSSELARKIDGVKQLIVKYKDLNGGVKKSYKILVNTSYSGTPKVLTNCLSEGVSSARTLAGVMGYTVAYKSGVEAGVSPNLYNEVLANNEDASLTFSLVLENSNSYVIKWSLNANQQGAPIVGSSTYSFPSQNSLTISSVNAQSKGYYYAHIFNQYDVFLGTEKFRVGYSSPPTYVINGFGGGDIVSQTLGSCSSIVPVSTGYETSMLAPSPSCATSDIGKTCYSLISTMPQKLYSYECKKYAIW